MVDLEVTFRDHLLSVYQSAAADYARKTAAESSGNLEGMSHPNAIVAAADRVAELHHRALTTNFDSPAPEAAGVEPEGIVGIAGKCAAIGFQLFQATAFGDEATASRLKREFALGTCDPRWGVRWWNTRSISAWMAREARFHTSGPRMLARR